MIDELHYPTFYTSLFENLQHTGFVCIVVITSALHAEGRGFDPHTEYSFLSFFFDIVLTVS